MRFRPFAALSAAALSVLVLAGCSSATTPEASPTTADTASTDICSVAAPTGDAVESVSVSGEVGEAPTVEFAAPLEVTSTERTVLVEGDGVAISDGDYISYALAVYDASTGEMVDSAGYDGTTVPPQAITIGSGADQFFGCATAGSRIAAVATSGTDGSAVVYVIDLLDVTPAAEWCQVSEPGDAWPTVEFSAEGVPTVTIPDADPPADLQLEVLEEGDGDVVESGDTVTVNYAGVKWSDGTTFDSSWDRGETAQFSTTGVVTGFQRALEGQTVGTTLVVSMPPACGYGEGEINDTDLVGETLVFVVEIVDTARAE